MCKKITKEEFIERSNKFHNHKFDYSLVDFNDIKSKVKIICPIHGIFEQSADSHSRGFGCSKCSGMYKKTTDEFIKEANEIHENKYNYSLSKYKNTKSKVKIICPIHGIFEQSAEQHLTKNSCGCPKCGAESGRIKVKFTLEQFIQKVQEIHENKYDYSKINYVNTATKINIICPIHGEYKQIAFQHLIGRGCFECGKLSSINTRSSTTEEFIKKSINIHDNKYNYSLVNYVNSFVKVNIICNIHGIFEQEPVSHLSGVGCPKCGIIKSANKRKYNNEIFIKKAKNVHGDKYDYSKINYINSTTNINIKCSKHGEFKQLPNNHLRGQGCPICKESIGEKETRKFLEKNKIDYIPQKTFDECKNEQLLIFDFYLPNKNVLIEFDGKQHFQSVKQWGGDEGFEIRKKRDQIKNKYAYDNNIKLIRIAYNESIEAKLLELI